MAKTVRRGFSKVRGRQAQKVQRVGSKMLACECGTEEKVDADVDKVTCHLCVQKLIPAPPKPKAPLTAEEKELRVARKLERVRVREAKRSGLVLLPTGKDLGFTRGWWFKRLFKTSLDEHGRDAGKIRYFSLGKEIDEKKFNKLHADFANSAVVAATQTFDSSSVSNDEKHTLIDPKGTKVSLTVRDFFKIHGLYSGHVKKLIAGVKPSYKGWKRA